MIVEVVDEVKVVVAEVVILFVVLSEDIVKGVFVEIELDFVADAVVVVVVVVVVNGFSTF